ncbi:hypothetical protein ABIA31_007929 [Catenulispora sp. MAP5-51]
MTKSRDRRLVSAKVSRLGTSSPRARTGLKKWIPITREGRRVAVPSLMIGIDDAFDSIENGVLVDDDLVELLVQARLRRLRLDDASTTRSRSASTSRRVTTRIRSSTASETASVRTAHLDGRPWIPVDGWSPPRGRRRLPETAAHLPRVIAVRASAAFAQAGLKMDDLPLCDVLASRSSLGVPAGCGKDESTCPHAQDCYAQRPGRPCCVQAQSPVHGDPAWPHRGHGDRDDRDEDRVRK